MKMKNLILFAIVSFFLFSVPLWAGGGQAAGSASGPVTIEIVQWWQPEMKAGSFEKVISDFEAKNPNIKVKTINLPYSQVLEQITVGSATGTLSDVIGTNPPWLSDFIKQGIIEPLDSYIAKEHFDVNSLAAQLVLQGKQWIFPVTTFLYPMYYNVDLFKAAGITDLPKNRSEFIETARKLTDKSKNQFGWVIPMGLANPNGTQHQVLSWAWAGGVSALKNGRPDMENDGVKSAVNHVLTLYKEGLVVPGAFNKVEQEQIEDFTAGRTAMIISSMAHINLFRQRNPNLKFDIFMVPGPDGYTGKKGLSMAGWWIGMSQKGKNKDAAFKLITHFLDKDENSWITSNANAFPGNKNSKPDFVTTDPLFAKAFEFYQQVDLRNEFMGLPNAPGLQRAFMEELHALFEGKQDLDTTMKNTQQRWIEIFDK